jgi:hypothetical protein
MEPSCSEPLGESLQPECYCAFEPEQYGPGLFSPLTVGSPEVTKGFALLYPLELTNAVHISTAVFSVGFRMGILEAKSSHRRAIRCSIVMPTRQIGFIVGQPVQTQNVELPHRVMYEI